MGHTGKSSGDIQRSSERTTKYSDVDSRTTPMPEEDIKQVTESVDRYFQSGNSFAINRVLRNMQEGQSLDDAFEDKGNLATVQAMDRNMLPLNKDIQVARMAADEYLNNLMSNAGFTDEEIRDVAWNGTQSILDRMNATLAGTIVGEKQFLSTSHKTDDFNSAFRNRPLKMNITAKAGTHAMFNPTRRSVTENEMVLARGTEHKLLKFYFEDNRLQVKTETIPQTKVRRKR